MKLRNASVGFVLAVASLALVAACNHQKRADWRNPASRAACSSDTDCPGGTCVIEIGASQGTCNPAALPTLPGADGGARPGPTQQPNIQPSSNDIQL